jgi:hypothetical protein
MTPRDALPLPLGGGMGAGGGDVRGGDCALWRVACVATGACGRARGVWSVVTKAVMSNVAWAKKPDSSGRFCLYSRHMT